MKKIILILLLTIIYNSIFTQNKNKIDSLIKAISNTKNDTNIINSFINIGNEYQQVLPDSAILYYKRSLDRIKILTNKNDSIYSLEALAYKKIGFIYVYQNNFDKTLRYWKKALNIYIQADNKKNIARSYINIGLLYSSVDNNNKAMEYSLKALKLSEAIKDQHFIALSLSSIGNQYLDQSNYTKALEYSIKSLKIIDKLEDKYNSALVNRRIGIIHFYQNDNNKAIIYWERALNIFKEINSKSGISGTLVNLGNAYKNLNNNTKALDLYLEALVINEEIGHKEFMAINLVNIGRIYREQHEYNKALEYYKKAVKINIEINNNSSLSNNYNAFGELYNNLKQYNKAIEYTKKGLIIAKKVGSLRIENDAYANLSKAYIGLNNYKKALEYKNKWIELNDSIFNADKAKSIAEISTKYESEKKEKQIIQQQAELKTSKLEAEKEKAEKERQQTQRNMFIVAFGLMIILAGFVFRSYNQKKKANILLAEQKEQITESNEELNQQNEEIIAQRDEIEQQRDIVVKQKEKIEEIHHEISQSIDYATRLQGAILADEKILSKYVSEHFVLFKPKDKVSGDFYWWSHIENHTIITAADSTGHGVPGAFMSMLGSSFLREIVQKEYVTHTGVILRKLRKEIIKALKQTGESGTQKDGMDMAIISIDHETNIVQFSGANNPLYVLTNRKLDNLEPLKDFENFYEIKSDKMPIAIYEKMDNFTTHEIQLEKGDQLYMFSDGFADQFGGPKGKKFKYKPFKQLLAENRDKSMKEQKDLLNLAFEIWRGDLEQIDDVVVLGVKI